MRVLFTFISFIFIITSNCFTQVTLVASDNGNKSLTTSSGGNFELLRGSTTISSWATNQAGATYFSSPGTPGIASLSSNGSNGNSIRLAITNNTGSTITNLTLNGTVLHHKENSGTNVTETLSASGVSGAGSWNISVTSDANSTVTVHNPPLESSFSGTISGLSFANGTTITITWNDANDAGTDAMFGFGAASLSWTVLPIKIKSFNVSTVSKKSDLRLITASETNNDYFTIERSGDGRSFDAIGEIKGAGNSTEEKHYEFTDENPLPGINYYRIKQTDFDGQYTYSEIRSVRHTGKGNVAISPRSTDGRLDISTEMESYDVAVYSSAGQEVARFNALAGHQTVNIEALQAGIYFVKVMSGTESETVRVAKF